MADHSASSSSNTCIVPDSRVIYEKINSAFSNVSWSSLLSNGGLVQFWAPQELTTTQGRRRRVLTTCNQPFIVEDKLHSWFRDYRLRCLKYLLSIDDHDHDNVNLNINNNNLHEVVVVDDNPLIVISRCGPDIPFLNHLPSLVHMNGNLQGLRLLFLPVFYSSSCVGVIGCSMMLSSSPSVIFKHLKGALERVGYLTMFHVQESPVYKTVRSLKHATDEIEEALEIVHVSHGLTLCQVWIASQNENCVPFSSSTQKKHKYAVRLKGFCADSHPLAIKDYYDTCDMIPLKMGEGIAGKTLKSYEPHCCTDINGVSENWLFPAGAMNPKTSCFAICLRSIADVNVDYVFEFLWPISRNYVIMLESIILTLKSCLPSFKFPSGAQLGDELCVLDVDKSSTGSGIEYFTILQGKRFSQIPKAVLEQGRGSMPEDCISSTVVRPKMTSIQTNVKQGPTFVKRKLSNLSNSQVDCNQEYKRPKQEHSSSSNSETSPHKCDQEIIAHFKENTSVFLLPVTIKLADLKKRIEKEFDLAAETYMLEYLFEGNWVMLNDDEDMTNWAIVLKSFHSKLRVLFTS